MRVCDVINLVKTTLKLNDGEAGLFVSVGQLWLDPDLPLSDYKGLRFLVTFSSYFFKLNTKFFVFVNISFLTLK